jgi:glycine betaine/proline transport system ATP-binding protein
VSDTIKISIRSLYKIFGADPIAALQHVYGGTTKADLLHEHGHVLGLKDINIDMRGGDITVIMGLSGSGKSTLIRHLNRLIEPTAGQIEVDGEDVLAYDEDKLRNLRRQVMSMVFQKFALLPHRTVAENAATTLKVRGVSKREYLEEADKWLDRVGLHGFGGHYPHQLSGGMQQRVGIARALTSNSPIMLMDEAFSALDPLIRRQMQDEMMEIQNELHKTILFITHDLNEALRIGDRVCIMKDGAVVQIGTPEEILTQPATGYVAEFVQDVDQGRVIDVRTIMSPPALVNESMGLLDAVRAMGDGFTAFTVDEAGHPTGLVSEHDAMRGLAAGKTQVSDIIRTVFDTTPPDATFNEVYAKAGRALGLGVVDEAGVLIGTVDPKAVLEEMGRVESLIDGFEREVFM